MSNARPWIGKNYRNFLSRFCLNENPSILTYPRRRPTSTRSVDITTTSTVTTTITTVQTRTSTVQTVIVQRRATLPALQLRQASTTLSTPVPLQTFDVNVLSAACSLFASSPPPAPATTATYSSRVLQTSYVTQPANTIFSTNVVSTDATVTSGASTSTGTYVWQRMPGPYLMQLHGRISVTDSIDYQVPLRLP